MSPFLSLFLQLIQLEEGCKLTAYKDSEGVWTIGWGYNLETHGYAPGEAVDGDPGYATDLLLRGIIQASNAVALLREMGDSLTPSQGRQCSGAILLAVATLVAAEREARGAASASGDLRFFRSDTEAGTNTPDPAQGGLWQRLRHWWHEVTTAAMVRRELQSSVLAYRLRQADFAEIKRIMGAMGHLLRGVAWMLAPNQQETVDRLLADGRRLAKSGEAHA
jgi:hypothetical protein